MSNMEYVRLPSLFLRLLRVTYVFSSRVPVLFCYEGNVTVLSWACPGVRPAAIRVRPNQASATLMPPRMQRVSVRMYVHVMLIIRGGWSRCAPRS